MTLPERWGILAIGGLRNYNMSFGKSSHQRHKHFGSGIGFQYIKKDKISFLLEITGLDGVTECSVHEFGS